MRDLRSGLLSDGPIGHVPWEHERGRGWQGVFLKDDDNSTKYVELRTKKQQCGT